MKKFAAAFILLIGMISFTGFSTTTTDLSQNQNYDLVDFEQKSQDQIVVTNLEITNAADLWQNQTDSQFIIIANHYQDLDFNANQIALEKEFQNTVRKQPLSPFKTKTNKRNPRDGLRSSLFKKNLNTTKNS